MRCLPILLLSGACVSLALCQEPNLEETGSFLQSKLSGLQVTSNASKAGGSSGDITSNNYEFNVSGCAADWGKVIVFIREKHEYKMKLGFGGLDGNSIKVDQVKATDVTVSPPMFYVDFLFDQLLSYTDNGVTMTGKDFQIYTGSQDLAERIAKALKHAAALCGAKKEPF
jgi:hypothetical protein